ncbi:FAD dependent oxidoreductase [Pseudomassariella vexata]|uniref:FAD dependent oxidoreductase n=1 Tax=Pseudomassariella vexata TaxID=1141098 RepID=A0A1Y2EHR6_9PEZI|nr:FAD dependent oxidoreductase [Pseudomassariella vexata]ORY71122.1 FAD dependent oxidoreductase [Pseudomassariella vexata]
MPRLNPNSKILIVGSGVFGISTALWLARSGYRDVTVLDMQDTETAGYDPAVGIDSASADINKIIRFSYGEEIEYQRLATQAAGMWDEWNRQIVEESEDLPESLKKTDKLWWKSGFLRLSTTGELGEFELKTLRNMEREGIRDTQFRSDDTAERFGVHKAVLDSTAGFVEAYKSCAFALCLAKKAGVKFILHPMQGKVVSLDVTQEGKPAIKTADGLTHEGDLVVVAGGGWTPSLIPEADGLLETTAGSIATIQLPKDRPDLWERFAPENFPVVTWGMKEGKGIYSFPRDGNGVIKVGYRGTKWTNYDDVEGRRISVPKTEHVTEKKEKNLPLTSIAAIKEYISVNMPELAEFGISSTKLCWYTDSIDNSFVVDFVPGRPGLAIASGGSGHGFKFLPILGREVVKILEGNGNETVYGNMWRWRHSTTPKRNGLEEGEDGPRVLAKQKMSSEVDWSFLSGSSKL